MEQLTWALCARVEEESRQVLWSNGHGPYVLGWKKKAGRFDGAMDMGLMC